MQMCIYHIVWIPLAVAPQCYEMEPFLFCVIIENSMAASKTKCPTIVLHFLLCFQTLLYQVYLKTLFEGL